MSLKKYFIVLAAIFTASISSAQDGWGPTEVGTTLPVVRVSSLASRTNLIPDANLGGEAKDKRSINPVVVIGKDKQTEDDYFVTHRNPLEQSVRAQVPSIVFDAYSSNSTPTDPAIAVGPNHIFAVWNTAFRIFNKDGTPATPALSVNNIFSGGGCCDLTVSYDQQADRFVLSYLFFNGQIQVAVSTGSDPVNDDFNVYTIPNVQDYNKLSVGPNAYYISANTNPQRVWALNRSEMILGNTTAGFQVFNIPGFQGGPAFNAPQVANISNSDSPDLPATLVHMADDGFNGVTFDHVKVWSVDVDFDNSGNSSISQPLELALTPFLATFDGGGFQNLEQPLGGSDIDALQNTIMNQAQVRKFDDHNSLVFNFVVDTDGTTGELAGIRWVELRQDTEADPWSVFQEGTYTSPDGKHAWCGSMIMDKDGNIALGYTAMSGPTTSTTVRASSFYTGRLADDPLGTMTFAEESISFGTGNFPGTNGRYGDYAKMDIDPNNDLDFWFISELVDSGRQGVVGKFTFTDPATRQINDIGVIDITSPLESDPLSSSEDITVLINNFGTEPITDPELQYVVDGGTPVVENFSGTIEPEETVSFTFATPANLENTAEFIVQVQSNLSEDAVPTNDDTERRYPALLGVDNPIESSEIIVTTLPNKLFELSLNTSYSDILSVTVFNALGQQVAFNNIEKDGAGFTYTLNMSYAATGVYVIRMGDQTTKTYQTAKIIVK